MRLMGWLVHLVARVPARVEHKLLAAFLAIVALLIIVGAIALQALSGINQRTEELIALQRKIGAYRQVQHDTTSQLYSVSSAFLSSDDLTLSSTLRQLNQFGYDVDRLQFVAKDEVELLGRFRLDYDRFVEIITHVVELIRAGRPAEAREIQAAQAAPLADRLERLTNQLVNKAESDVVAGIETSKQAYENSQRIVIAFALGSIVLALGLGYVISWSLIGPVKKIEAQLNQVAAGEFAPRLDVVNRDELGALAANVNKMSDELGQLYAQLEAASKHKSQFLANMSHELRTPLNAIIGFSQLMGSQTFGPLGSQKYGDYCAHILASGEYLSRVVSDVLDMARLEAGRERLDYQRFRAEEAVRRAVLDVAPTAREKGVSVRVEVEPEVTVEADPLAVERILTTYETITVVGASADPAKAAHGPAAHPPARLGRRPRERRTWRASSLRAGPPDAFPGA